MPPRPRATGGLAISWLVGAALLSSACGVGSEAPSGRVLLLGLDGASLRVAGPLMEQGRLPTLSQLAERGVSGPLRSLPPLVSPRIWTSVATGKTPRHHGIRGWVKRDAKGNPRLYTSRDRSAHALWNIASRAGLAVGVVNWLCTYPPDRIHGVMVTDHALPGSMGGMRKILNWYARKNFGKELAPPPERPGPTTYPAAWAGRVADVVETRGPVGERGATEDERLVHAVIDQNLARDEELVEVAVEIDDEIHPDVLMVLLQGIDRVSHAFWAGVAPPDAYPEDLRPTPEQRDAWGRALRGYYQDTDALVASLLERFGPDDLVVVLSDHGFEASPEPGPFGTGEHNSPRARNGVLFARGPGIPEGTPAGDVTVLDITPTILAWLGLPVAEDMQGHPAPFLEGAEPEEIASYDTEPIERLADRPSGVEDDIIDDLRSLGYVR